MARLAEEISKLTNPLPQFEDPEDLNDQTAAKLLCHGDEDEDAKNELRLNRSKLRSRVAALQLEEDVKYSGRRVSRRSVMNDDDDDDDSAGDTDDDDDDESLQVEFGDSHQGSSEEKNDSSDDVGDDDDVIRSDDEDENIARFKEKLKYHEKSHPTGHDDDTNGAADDEEEEEEDDDDDDEDEGSDEDDNEDNENNLQTFTKVDVEAEIQKGKAVRAQLAIWDSLLEGRIKLQKALLIVNQLPQPDVWDEFIDAAGPEYSDVLAESENSLKNLLEQLVELQTALLLQNPDTKQLLESGEQSNVKSSQPAVGDDDDEEITSEEDEDAKYNKPHPAARNLKRKLKEGRYPEFLAKRHKDFQQFRNSTIQKWYDKTRVASGRLSKGFTAFDQSALRQIEQILSDKERLVKRTQLRRSAYKVLGKPEREKPKEEDTEENADRERLPIRDHLTNYDEEIFDDDDFYHQQLRELIERKTADINDPVALTRQWLEIQKLRNKKKKVVDTKASKGRKIRYDVHKKLVNFMAPYDNMRWTDEAKDELFGSLFGKKHTQDVEQPTR